MGKTTQLPDPDLDQKLDEAFGDPTELKTALAGAAGTGDVAAFRAALNAAAHGAAHNQVQVAIPEIGYVLSGPLGETRSLAEALAAVQARIPEVIKAEEGEVKKDGVLQYKYSYADLAAVTRAILPMLGAVGLSWITKPTMVDGKFVLAYKLLHISGEVEEGIYPLPTGGTPQATGSAITYARRYCLCSVTGIAPADDDDAAEAQAAHKSDNGRSTAPKGMSTFERETGLALLYLPSAEQRETAGLVLMNQAFRQALDFALCLDEHQAWDEVWRKGDGAPNWRQTFTERITDEIGHADTGEQVNALWQMLKAAKLLTEPVAVQLKEHAAAIKERNAKAFDTITGQVLNATLEDIESSTGPVGVSITEAFAQGRITDEQRKELIALVGERIAKLQREQGQKAAE